jgi:hypothetical protein
MEEKNEAVTFRIRGKGETIARGKSRKSAIKREARRRGCSEAEFIRDAIDLGINVKL